MVLIYRALSNILFPVFTLIIYLRKILKKEDRYRYREKIFPKYFNITRKDNAKLIWFHAASIGELKSIVPILSEINKKQKNIEFLVTTITLSSANLAKEEFKNFKNVFHRFFPIDSEFLIKKFLKLWKPNVIFLVESEIWPNLILVAKKNGIPLSLLNARITTKTFKRWMIINSFAKKIFNSFDLCLASNNETQVYLDRLNAKNIHFLGNIKLINYIDDRKLNIQNEEVLTKRRFWIAISTHSGEETLCLNVHLKLKKFYENFKTIVAPRHIQRINYIKKLCENFKISYQILDKNDLIDDSKEIILINSYGNLGIFLKYAKSVFIGKSTVKKLRHVGGQSPIDAAKMGCKIYHGPYIYNFSEIYQILKENNISREIEGSEDLAKNLERDLRNMEKNKREISAKINSLGIKTLNNTMQKIDNFLVNEII
tara:strand:+ start:43 stop:1326 length:1284 start_codon:yes stop_codon:yes gene_type:complete